MNRWRSFDFCKFLFKYKSQFTTTLKLKFDSARALTEQCLEARALDSAGRSTVNESSSFAWAAQQLSSNGKNENNKKFFNRKLIFEENLNCYILNNFVLKQHVSQDSGQSGKTLLQLTHFLEKVVLTTYLCK